MTEQIEAPSPQTDRTLPAVVYGLYLLGFATVVTAIIGLVIAYSRRDDSDAVARTHYVFLIRTFWLSIVWWLIGGAMVLFGMPLMLVLVGFPIFFVGWAILALISVWWAVRCIAGVLYLAGGKPYPRPLAWLV